MYYRLNPPPDLTAQNDKEINRVNRVNRSRIVTFKNEKKRGEFEKYVKDRFNVWKTKSSPLRNRLINANDFLEGKDPPIDWPFGEDSSNIDVKYALGKARTLRANFMRAVFSDPRLFVAVLGPGASRERLNDLEEAVNWTATEGSNLVDMLRDSPIPIFRDGTGLIYGEWERKIEHGTDYKIYTDAQAFQSDYPDAETAGVGEEEYQRILSDLSNPDVGEVQVEFETDFVAKDRPEYTQFPVAKFVWYPLSVPSMRELDIYGFLFPQSHFDFEMADKYGYFYHDIAEGCRKAGTSGSGGGEKKDYDQWDSRRDQIDGISAGEEDFRISYKLAKLVVRFDRDGDGIPECYFVIWDTEKDKALRVENYSIRKNIPCIHPFRFIRKDGRLLGESLLLDSEDLFREINALHRHRSNTRRLTDAPTLLMPKVMKDDIDLGAERNTIVPGKVMWLADQYMNANMRPTQLIYRNLDNSGGSIDEETYVQRYLDTLLGTSEGQSGKETPSDPRAPARKTAMLLMRGDLRLEDFIEEWKRSIPDLLEFHRSLYFQNTVGKLKYVSKVGGEAAEKEIPKAMLVSPGVSSALKGISLNMTPENEMQKVMALFAAAIQMQIVKINPAMIVQFWNDFVAASRIQRPERFQIQPGGPAGLGGGGGGGMPGAEGGGATSPPPAQMTQFLSQIFNSIPQGVLPINK